MIDEPELLDRKEAAEYFGVTKDTIRNWIRLGWLPPPLLLPNGKSRWTMEMLRSAIKNPAESAAA
jgi:predicted site-specific integrase-resolvase